MSVSMIRQTEVGYIIMLEEKSEGLVINYGEGGGLQNGKIVGPKLFAPPPPSRQGKTFHAPPFKEWKLFVTPLQNG